MTRYGKILYTAFMSGLVCCAATACYWQTTKYFLVRDQWKIIGKELSEKPKNIANMTDAQIKSLYAYKYLEITGEILPTYTKIERLKNGRMGYLVLRPIKYQVGSSSHPQDLLVVEGWCPEHYIFNPKEFKGSVNGILRQKQKADFLNEQVSPADMALFKMQTFINLDKAAQDFGLKKDELNQKYYLEILKPITGDNGQDYPYQHSVDNFVLPYLTPDKHRAYGIFWFGAAFVGTLSIVKSLRM